MKNDVFNLSEGAQPFEGLASSLLNKFGYGDGLKNVEMNSMAGNHHIGAVDPLASAELKIKQVLEAEDDDDDDENDEQSGGEIDA